MIQKKIVAKFKQLVMSVLPEVDSFLFIFDFKSLRSSLDWDEYSFISTFKILLIIYNKKKKKKKRNEKVLIVLLFVCLLSYIHMYVYFYVRAYVREHVHLTYVKIKSTYTSYLTCNLSFYTIFGRKKRDVKVRKSKKERNFDLGFEFDYVT